MKYLFIALLFFAIPSLAQTTGGITIPAPSTGNGQFIQSNGSGLVLSSAVALAPGQGILYTVTDTLTAAQVTEANTTAVTLLGAVANKVIVPVSVIATVKSTGHTPFAGSTAGPSIIWGNSNKDILVTLTANYINQASDYTQVTSSIDPGNANDANASVVNVPLQFFVTNTGFTGGTGSTLIITVVYYLQ
jgi:hypothetical protein